MARSRLDTLAFILGICLLAAGAAAAVYFLAYTLQALVHQENSSILADEFMSLAILENRPLYFQPFEMTQLAALVYGTNLGSYPKLTMANLL